MRVESGWLMGAADCYNMKPINGEAVQPAGASLEEQPESLKGKALPPPLSYSFFEGRKSMQTELLGRVPYECHFMSTLL